MLHSLVRGRQRANHLFESRRMSPTTDSGLQPRSRSAGANTRPTVCDASISPCDQVLMSALQNGDDAALALLYSRYAARMLVLAHSIARDHRDAEDIVHDVFLELCKRAHSYREERGS